MGRVNRHQPRQPAKPAGNARAPLPSSETSESPPSNSIRRENRQRAGWIWAAVLLCALFFLSWIDRARIERINYVSSTATWSVDPPHEDGRSPTGYAGGRRRLIVPGHHNPSYRWISQTQQLVVDGRWRIHHVDSVNFPHGFATGETSIYRWWLAAVAWCDHVFSGRSPAIAVEHSAIHADPLLQGLLLISAGLFTFLYFGGTASAVTTPALATLFPFASGFQAGAPDHHSLAWVCALWSVLPLSAGLQRQNSQGLFVLAGIAGGIAIWTDYFTGEAVLLGLSLGAGLASLIARKATGSAAPVPLPWRLWGLSGALTCLIACLFEYYPKSADWTVNSIHPLHGVAWLGLGELLHRSSFISDVRTGAARWRRAAGWILAAVAVLALPVVRSLSENGHFLAQDPFASELANLAPGVRASDIRTWFTRDGITLPLVATCLPLLLVGFSLYLLFSRKTPPTQRSALVLVLFPIFVALALASGQLRWWNGADALIVSLIPVSVSVLQQSWPATLRRLCGVIFFAVLLPGIFLLLPRFGSHGAGPLNEIELQSVVERDLAHWIGHQSGPTGAVVFASPGLTETLAFYGNLKGVASYDPENQSGISAAIRIASASTWTEASALLDGREITHVVLPSWDSTLVRLAQMGRQLPPDAPLPRNTFLSRLKQWDLPPWLQTMPYPMPAEAGSDRFAVRVFALCAPQDETLAACRLADYFIEMGFIDKIHAVREKLRLYPRSLPALTAVAQLDLSIDDRADYATTLESLLPYLSRRAARTLPLDRRISLAALLIQARQMDAARAQIQQCVADLTIERLHDLTTGQIVRVLAMSDWAGLNLPDPTLRPTALSLLPPSLRSRVTKASGRQP